METATDALASSARYSVGNQVPRYSGWKPTLFGYNIRVSVLVGNQVPRYSGWKLAVEAHLARGLTSDTKYRVIADGNTSAC